MDKGDWIQLVGAIAILLGLVLVLMELRQAQDFASAQLSLEVSNSMSELQTTIVGETLADVVAKSCQQPEQLTHGEQEVMIAFFRTQISNITRHIQVEDFGLLSMEPGETERLAANLGRVIVGTEIGRFWWEGNRGGWLASSYPEIFQIIDDLYEQYSVNAPGWCLWKESNNSYWERFAD